MQAPSSPAIRRVAVPSIAALLALLPLLLGCWSAPRDEVVVFAALDREFSEPILDDFQQQTGVTVRARYDVESTKTVQLVARIMHEKHPTCDLFWNNEILHTLRLQRMGLLEPFDPAAREQIPESYRAADGSWYGMAARARVLLVNTTLVAAEQRPTSIHDLTDPRWRNQVGMAKPFFGTTATHAAVLFARWGAEDAEAYYRQLAANAQILSGNKQVATAVGRGQLAFGITDTDDAIIELDQGRPVTIVFPDQGEDQMGTLFIPNTIAVIRGAPHPDQARQLADYLLSPSVEDRLAAGRSAQIPVLEASRGRSRALPNEPVRWMEVDFEAAASAWDESMQVLQQIFLDG